VRAAVEQAACASLADAQELVTADCNGAVARQNIIDAIR